MSNSVLKLSMVGSVSLILFLAKKRNGDSTNVMFRNQGHSVNILAESILLQFSEAQVLKNADQK